jgi:hypothetical protein
MESLCRVSEAWLVLPDVFISFLAVGRRLLAVPERHKKSEHSGQMDAVLWTGMCWKRSHTACSGVSPQDSDQEDSVPGNRMLRFADASQLFSGMPFAHADTWVDEIATRPLSKSRSYPGVLDLPFRDSDGPRP